MPDDLVAWLREQIAADEAVATEATEGPWADYLGQVLGGPDAQQLVADRAQVWNSDHITRHDPRAVLAQCEAHTALLALHQECTERAEHWRNEGHEKFAFAGSAAADATGFALKLLALAYQHRPGYREVWRPEPAGLGSPPMGE